MAWHIDTGPSEVNPAGYDGVLWQFRLQDEAGHQANVLVGVSGTALASASVPEKTARAIATRGRSAIEEVSGWPDPPSKIEFYTTDAPKISGGRPPRTTGAEDEEIARVVTALRDSGSEPRIEQVNRFWHAALDALNLETVANSELEAVRELQETYQVDRIRRWFHDQGYELLMDQPGGGEGGWFASFVRQGSTGGVAPYGWGPTRLSAAEDARREYLERQARAEAPDVVQN